MSFFDIYCGDNFKETQKAYEEIFQYFDKNKDGLLDLVEFHDLLNKLSNCNNGQNETFLDNDVNFIFKILDLNQDDFLSLEEFSLAWKYWLKQVLKPVNALVIVDVQNDFITGSLALINYSAGQDGAAVVPAINSLLDQNIFDVVVYTYDWHPKDHISFIDNICLRKLHTNSKVTSENASLQDKVVFDVNGFPREQVMWPRHCVQDSVGAQLHPDLKVVPGAFHIQKGSNSDVDSYSAFWDNCKLSQTNLASILGKHEVTDVYVCGLAYDVCVGFTAKHALKHGFKTVLIEDASRGVTLDGIHKMRNDLVNKGAYIADTHQVPLLTSGKLRPSSFITKAVMNYKAALELSIAKQET